MEILVMSVAVGAHWVTQVVPWFPVDHTPAPPPVLKAESPFMNSHCGCRRHVLSLYTVYK